MSAFVPALGVVEAYFGRVWSMQDRLDLIRQLPALGLNHFVYAPKGDTSLRSAWRAAFAQAQFDSLAHFVAVSRGAGVNAGLGFTPHGLTTLGARGERDALQHKASEIASLKLDTLYILFDDLPSSGKNMALEQLRIVELLAERCGVASIVVCPSYYSTDPVLEDVFGAMPEGYWQALGQGLDASMGLCWTGELVCSETYSKENLAFIAEAYGRLPVLWDNYPVNDSARLSNYLRVQPFSAREPWLAQYTAAHMVNPMNQPKLSALPLATLADCYTAANIQKPLPAAWGDVATQGLPAELLALMADSVDAFQQRGLADLSEAEKDALIARFDAFDLPLADEVTQWLRGEYAFDPECLTV